MCYGSTRFSEDIDLDAVPSARNKQAFFETLDDVCDENGWTYRKAKDTPFVSRAIVHYDDDAILKVEVSHRQSRIDPDLTQVVHGVRVYDIDSLCLMKCRAYGDRDRIRDVEDVVFIAERYGDSLSPVVRNSLAETLAQQGLEKFDYVVGTASESELANVDVVRLGERFLDVCEGLGVLVGNEHGEDSIVFSEDEDKPVPVWDGPVDGSDGIGRDFGC